MDFRQILQEDRDAILQRWIAAQRGTRADQLMSGKDLTAEAGTFLQALTQHPPTNGDVPPAVGDLAATLSRTRAIQGFTPAETAAFVLSLKDALLPSLERELAREPRQLAQQVLESNRFIDRLAVTTFEAFVTAREEVIRQQAKAIGELSTPVVELWEGILLLPVVGVLDTERSQQIMETLLGKIVETGADVVLMDITGVPLVDTAVARHILQTVEAAKLLGAETIICGISSRVAQTVVHLGVDLGTVVTRSSLAKGLKLAMTKTGGAKAPEATP